VATTAHKVSWPLSRAAVLLGSHASLANGPALPALYVGARIRLSPAMPELLPTFEIAPREPQRGSVIWLHGLGATNHDFDPIIPMLRAPYLRFVFPAAPIRPVTINGGMPMPAWYDILTLADPPLRESEPDVRESAAQLCALIEREHARGVRYENIVLAGFSQGGAMALHVGLRFAEKLSGLVVLSGYLLVPAKLAAERSANNQGTPILMCHGDDDPVVPEALAQLGKGILERAGYAPDYRVFPMEHSLSYEEVAVIAEWLAQRFPATPRDTSGAS
jgi:phospholipase/carboxylesterase